MKKPLSFLLFAPLLAMPCISQAQCNATITSASGCIPTTLTVNAGFAVQSIVWQLNGSTIQTYHAMWQANGITVAGGNGNGSNANQLAEPWLGNVDSLGNVYVADNVNNRVQKWAPGATAGVTVAGGNGGGPANNQLSGPRGAFALNNGTVYAGDENNNRVMKWLAGGTSGTVVAGGNGQGSAANQLNTNYGVFVDDTGNVYVSDFPNNRVQKWAPGATTGITVAGGNGQGTGPNQFNQVYNCYVDDTGNVYATDVINSRIQKWAPGAAAGITVAGGNGNGSGLSQLFFPFGVYVDKPGNVYIADQVNSRIVVWAPGAAAGVIIAGGNGTGPAANQLNEPSGIWLDDTGNIYVSDMGNYRVQEFKAGITDTLAAVAQGTYTAIITGFNGCNDTVTYIPLNAAVTAAGATTFCAGDTVKLESTTGNGYTYQWQMNGGNISGATDSTYNATTSGSFAVVIGNGSCTGTSLQVVVTVNPSPSPVITANGNILSTTAGFTTYQWYLNGQAISGATASSYTSTQAGHYTVRVTGGNGCAGTSPVLPLAVGNINGNTFISLYPNPSSSIVYINATQQVNISVRSTDGREVIQKDNAKEIDLSPFADGVYLIKITGTEGKLLKMDKIIKASGN